MGAPRNSRWRFGHSQRMQNNRRMQIYAWQNKNATPQPTQQWVQLELPLEENHSNTQEAISKV